MKQSQYIHVISGLFGGYGTWVGNDQLEGTFALQYAALFSDYWPENTIIWD
jgi:hypothetical protein